MTDKTLRMLAELDPRAQPVFRTFFDLLDQALGEDQYIFFEGRRTKEIQEAYYAQGRETLEEVNALRKNAGLYLLRSEKDNYKITWTMESKHRLGLAVDVLPVNGAGNPTWDYAHYKKIFGIIYACGLDAGLECGADWPQDKWDPPHYEIKG